MKNIPFKDLKSKNKLYKLLFIESHTDLINNYNVFLLNDRLVEEPNPRLKKVHNRIFYLMRNIKLPEYLFSVKGRSNIDNANYHSNSKNIVTMDIAKFFPKSSFDRVFDYFYNKLNLSHDNAMILSELITIDYNCVSIDDNITDWFAKTNKELKYNIPERHLPTGSSISQLMSFLIYKDMFDEIEDFSKKRNIRMSVYVDDLTFSSNYNISKPFIKSIGYIVSKYGLELNNSKTSIYNNETSKKVTGIYIDKDGKLKAPSKLHLDVTKMFKEFKFGKNDKANKLLGKAIYVNRVEKGKFSNIIKAIKKKR